MRHVKNFGDFMITAMNHITLAIHDIDRSFAFYRDILGLKPLVKWDNGAYFLVGAENSDTPGAGFWLCLNVDAKHAPVAGYTHYAFSVSADDFALMVKRITGAGYEIFKENTSPGESLYFLDPDGHKLEIHVGSHKTRIAAQKQNPGHWTGVEWFV